MMSFLPGVVTALLQRHPAASISLTETLDDELLPLLRSGHLDLIFDPISDVHSPASEVVEELLFQDAFSIGVDLNHPLHRRRTLSLSELRDAAWVLPGPENTLRRHLEKLFASAGITWPENCVTTTSLGVIESILRSTDHVALITGMLQRAWRVKSLPLRGAGHRSIGIKRRRVGTLSPLAEQTREIAFEHGQLFVRPHQTLASVPPHTQPLAG
jgi:DNA-binding transcriptional LysR family regulator